MVLPEVQDCDARDYWRGAVRECQLGVVGSEFTVHSFQFGMRYALAGIGELILSGAYRVLKYWVLNTRHTVFNYFHTEWTSICDFLPSRPIETHHE